LNFDGVNLGLSGTPAQDGDKRQLPSRFAFKDSPFSGWVDKQLRRRFNFTCVDSPADLKTVDRGITITGQTSDGRRGAHGGKRKPIIGFSNAERQNELLREIEDAKDEFTRIEKRQGELGLERRNLEALRIAYTYVKATSWDSIDVTGIDALRQDLQSRRNRILGANNLLAQLKEEADGVAAKLESATRQKVLAESAVEGLDKRHEALSVRHDEVMTEIWDLEDNHRVALSDELTQRLDAEFEKLATERRSDRLTVALGKLKDSLNSLTVSAEREVENHTRALETKFKAFLQQWERPDLGETLAFYPTYRDILLELKSEGLHERRSKFTREVNEWSGIDLLRVSSSYNDAMDEIDSRLDPVNEILRRLPFGAGRDRLKLRKHQTTTPDVSSFLRELRMLASNTAELESEEAATARFKTLQQFISRLSAANERDYLIDVRRHISIEAERIDADGVVKNVYVSIAGKSGGESQELIAFIIGSALRYQLGDEDWPRYAPVILDEAFIKADEAFTGRAVEAWKGLGFQLIVAAPDDKVNSIERHIDRILCVTKSSHHHSRVTELHDLPPTP